MANEIPYLAPIDMNAHKIINTAEGVDDYDVVVVKQLKDEKVKVDATDTTVGYLTDKITSTDGSVEITNTGSALDLSVNSVDTYAFNILDADFTITETEANILGLDPTAINIKVFMPERSLAKYKYVIHNTSLAFDLTIVLPNTSEIYLPHQNKIELYLAQAGHLGDYIFDDYANINIGSNLNTNNSTNKAVVGNSNSVIQNSLLLGENNATIKNAVIIGSEQGNIGLDTDINKNDNAISIGNTNSAINDGAIGIGNLVSNTTKKSIALGHSTIGGFQKNVALGSYTHVDGANQVVSTANNDGNHYANHILQLFKDTNFDNSTTDPRPVPIINESGDIYNVLLHNYDITANYLYNFFAQINCVVVNVPTGQEAFLGSVKAWNYNGVAKKYGTDKYLLTNPIMNLLHQDICSELDNVNMYFTIESGELRLMFQTNVGTGGWEFKVSANLQITETRF